MAYKFQIGASEMGGALTQEGALVVESSISGSTTLAGASISVDGKVDGSEVSSSADLLAGGILTVAGAVRLAGVAATAVDVSADDLYFLDSGGLMKRTAFSDYATELAGTSITADSGVLSVSDNGVTLAKMAGLARGSIIIGDASGDPSALVKGAAHTFLQSDGTDSAYVALSGDATLAAGVLTIENDVVSLAKMEGIDRGSFIVGDAFGNPSALALGTAGQFLVSDDDDMIYRSLSGDATLAANGALTIANNAVSLAKMDDLTRGSIIIGDASGDPSALAKGAANTFLQSNGTDTAYVALSGDATLSAGVLTIANDVVTLAKMANLTRGSIILGSGSNDPSALALGSANQFFQSDGTDAAWVSMSGDVALADGVATIQANAVEGSMLNDNVISGQTDLPSGIVGTDEFMISDAGVLKRVDLTVYGSFLAGAGITATNGVLSLDSAGAPVARPDDNVSALTEGVNYGSAALTADRTWTLPSSPTAGDVVRVKAPASIGEFRVTVAAGAGKNIEGVGSVDLESPGAAIAVIYLGSNTWGIF